ncbi:MAG TPA: hypothetical protein VGC66_16530 [Pyrinomonadaceae bacterium]|jgi:hypothetical protein
MLHRPTASTIAISSGVKRVKLINQIVYLAVERSALVCVVGAVAGCGHVLDNLHDFARSDLFEKFKRLWHKRLKVLIPVAEGKKNQDGDIE